MYRQFARKSLFVLGVVVVLGTYLLPMVAAVRYGSASALRPVVVLSWIIPVLTWVFAALCYAEIASTAPTDAIAYAATKERFAWMLGWPLLLAFAVDCAVLAVIGLRSFGVSDFLPIDQLIHLANLATLFAFLVVSFAVLILRRKYPTAGRTFRCPGGPVIPILGILINLLLMFSLPTEAWLRLIAWLAIGVGVYFALGRRRRSAGRAGEAA